MQSLRRSPQQTKKMSNSRFCSLFYVKGRMGDQADNQSLQDEQDEQRLPIEKERATEANEIDLTEGKRNSETLRKDLLRII